MSRLREAALLSAFFALLASPYATINIDDEQSSTCPRMSFTHALHHQCPPLLDLRCVLALTRARNVANFIDCNLGLLKILIYFLYARSNML